MLRTRAAGELSVVVIPAIDVLRGQAVRLRQGGYGTETVYAADPGDAARTFIDAGATRLHVVDLDAARGTPTPESGAAVARVVEMCVRAGCEVEVGGGVRGVEAALHWLRAGATLVVLGSVAAREPALAVAICEATDGRVLVGLDVRAGIARVQGWTEDGLAATELLRVWSGWRATGLVYTDTTRDGVLAGPNLEGLRSCRELFTGPVIVSGGIGSLDDITACAAAGAAGVVIGKALYEGRFDLAAALQTVTGLAR